MIIILTSINITLWVIAYALINIGIKLKEYSMMIRIQLDEPTNKDYKSIEYKE